MKPIKPITFHEEDKKDVVSQSLGQEISQGVPKSTDPINYPVFSIPVGKKVLIYVPNHVVQDAEGKDCLRQDMPLIHSLTVGKRYLSIRCTEGFVFEKYGFDGTCPCCLNKDDPWTLANLVIEKKCKQQGLSPEDKENPTVKAIRTSEYSERKLKEAVKYHTFPIVVFETLNDDGKTFVMDENNQYKCTPMWYTCSDKIWTDKWMKALESMEEEPSHPGGNFFLLNYIYTPKKGEQNARDAARELSISPRKFKNSEQIRNYLDQKTEDWDVSKAQETVIANQYYSLDTMESLVNDCLDQTRKLIELYEANEEGAVDNSGFKLEKAEGEDEAAKLPVNGMPIETDLDSGEEEA